MRLTSVLLILCAAFVKSETQKCGYEICNPGKPDMINVHIVSHSHDDVGWLKTMDGYYTQDVEAIITSVTDNLFKYDDWMFGYVEIAYFSRWWNEQTETKKKNVKMLVNSGRLQFVGAGWVMNDEAVCHYEEIIDQMTAGNRWLNDTFGACSTPKSIWQIDPFGHSKEQAALFAQMGFDGMFLGRIDYQDISIRKSQKRMEFYWDGNTGQGVEENNDIFTGVLPNLYFAPEGFNYDYWSGRADLTNETVVQKSKDLIKIIQNQIQMYATNHTILTMGLDFQYRDAHKWYYNLKMLITTINKMQENGSEINLFFSTPTCYLKSLNSVNKTWEVEKNDFFPYASEVNAYWTGYYTSRPTLKYYTRKAASFLQTCKQLTAMASMPNTTTALQHAVAVMQHHDAITGTATQRVTNDYALIIAEGVAQCQQEVKTAMIKLNLSNSTDLQFCNSLNQTECPITENEQNFQLIMYNSLSHGLNTFGKLPVIGQGFAVYDSTGQKLPIQVVPIFKPFEQLPHRKSKAKYELIFPAVLPAMGAAQFSIKQQRDSGPLAYPDHYMSKQSNSIQNEHFTVTIDPVTGLLESVVTAEIEMKLKQNYHYYVSSNQTTEKKPSGAYGFNPLYDVTKPISTNPATTIHKGDLVEEIRQIFSPWASQVIRLYKGKPYVEFDWVLGPLPIEDGLSKEVVSKFSTNWKTGGIFYHDSNGRHTTKRIRDYRPSWNLTVNEPVDGNYYPMTGWTYIKDEANDLQLTLLSDRAQGASSIEDGSIEILVHRRTVFDDDNGVREPLLETDSNGKGLVVRGKHWLVINKIDQTEKQIRELAKELYREPEYIFSVADSQTDNSGIEFSALAISLPENVHIMTLELINDDEILLRLENFHESGNEPLPAQVNLKNLFWAFQITSVKETTLSAMTYLEDVHRLKWNTVENVNQSKVDDAIDALHSTTDKLNFFESIIDKLHFGYSTNFEITLNPMEIRTFIVAIKRPSVQFMPVKKVAVPFFNMEKIYFLLSFGGFLCLICYICLKRKGDTLNYYKLPTFFSPAPGQKNK